MKESLLYIRQWSFVYPLYNFCSLAARAGKEWNELLAHVLQFRFWQAWNPYFRTCVCYRLRASSLVLTLKVKSTEDRALAFKHPTFLPCLENWWHSIHDCVTECPDSLLSLVMVIWHTPLCLSVSHPPLLCVCSPVSLFISLSLSPFLTIPPWCVCVTWGLLTSQTCLWCWWSH